MDPNPQPAANASPEEVKQPATEEEAKQPVVEPQPVARRGYGRGARPVARSPDAYCNGYLINYWERHNEPDSSSDSW